VIFGRPGPRCGTRCRASSNARAKPLHLDGEVFEHFETAESLWRSGDELRASGNVRYRITSVIPIELVEEFHDSPLCGLLQVEPLNSL
jgi:hypothetical protein